MWSTRRSSGGVQQRVSVAVCSLLMFITQPSAAQRNMTNMTLSELVESLFNETIYNSRSRPGADTGKPLPVYINININDISSISEINMEFSTTLYLRQIWRDYRLQFPGTRNVTLNHKQFDRMWTPDVFIRNLKSGLFHTITVPNRLIRLSPDGTILYSQRLTLTLACDMVLVRYPMDNQTCKIEFGSYAYTTEDLVFEWRTDAKAVELNSDIRLPEYDLTGVTNVVCSQNINSTGNFPCLRAHILLQRRLRAYVLSMFLPSLLVVLLSWVSFWIDFESVPARISLGILTMLTITTQSSGHPRGMPAVSFTKAIDVWMATCLVFVFGSFIEYSVVNVLARREKGRRDAMAAAAATKSATAAIMLPVQLTTTAVPKKSSKDSTGTPLTTVTNNYSPSPSVPPHRLFFRSGHKQRKSIQSPEERQEMIPLTSVPSGAEDTGGSDCDQSPARSPAIRSLHHSGSTLVTSPGLNCPGSPAPVTVHVGAGSTPPPYGGYYPYSTTSSPIGGAIYQHHRADCVDCSASTSLLVQCPASPPKSTPGPTFERRLIEAQWNGRTGGGGSIGGGGIIGGVSFTCGGGGSGSVRHRLMTAVPPEMTSSSSASAMTGNSISEESKPSLPSMSTDDGAFEGGVGGLGSRICRAWRQYASRFRSQAQMVDVMSRVLFPVMFLIFNVIYWPFYLLF